MRTANRVLVAVFGLFLIAGGLLASVEIAVAFVGRGPWVVPYNGWYHTARSHDWQSGSARGIFLLVGAVGLFLFVAQLVRRGPLTMVLRSDTEVTYAVRRRSLERSLMRSIEHVDGVESAGVKINRSAVRVRARSDRRLPGDVKLAIQTAIDGRLHELELQAPPRVRISLRLRGESS
jgi:hypothetical protein